MDCRVIRSLLDSPAIGILHALEKDGFRVELTADNVIRIAPKSRLTTARMTEIAAHKTDIKTLIRACDQGVRDRVEVFRAQLEAPGTVGPFLFTAGVPYTKAICFSSGAALLEPRYGRCRRCSLAWRMAVRVPMPAESAAAYDGARVMA